MKEKFSLHSASFEKETAHAPHISSEPACRSTLPHHAIMPRWRLKPHRCALWSALTLPVPHSGKECCMLATGAISLHTHFPSADFHAASVCFPCFPLCLHCTALHCTTTVLSSLTDQPVNHVWHALLVLLTRLRTAPIVSTTCVSFLTPPE